MKIALIQINPVIGAIDENEALIKEAITRCHQSADLLVFSELVLIGYPPRDLLHRENFIQDNLAAVNRIVEFTKTIKSAVAFGYVEVNKTDFGKPLFNAVCVAQDGEVIQKRYKTLLPTYDVFHERRYFQPGIQEEIVPANIRVGDEIVPVGFVICEESWNDMEYWKSHEYPFDPVDIMAQKGAKCIVNINGSPFRIDGEDTVDTIRKDMVAAHIRKTGLPFVYVNQVGANDEIIFDGNSFAMNSSGHVIAQAMACYQDICIADIFQDKVIPVTQIPIEHSILACLVLGVKDYFQKQPAFRDAKAILGLSGGIDSALVAYIAQQALGSGRVFGIGMPSEFSSTGSVDDAQLLADKLGIKFFKAPIGDIHSLLRKNCGNLIEQMASSVPLPGKCDYLAWGVSDENLQPRIRMALLMFMANITNGILLTTGNKSETAVGYCTLYGDMAGGLAVINDVPKTMVYRICRYINELTRSEIVPWNTINKPPSAELRPGQKDQDSLPPYDLLDEVMKKFVDDEKSTEQILLEIATFDREMKYNRDTDRTLRADIQWVCGAILRNEYKRKQSPKGLKITKKHFGEGWQMPIVHGAKL